MIQCASETKNERDLFLNLGPDPIADRDAAIAACMIDAVADRQWFRQNPGKKERHRPASSRERKANALPVGSTVVVVRLKNGAQTRLFFGPSDKTASNPTTTKK
jgi:hypothetical protein